MKRTLTRIMALVALASTSGTVKADQTTKTAAQLAIEQFNDCADSLFKDDFESAEIDHELSLNKKWVLFLSAKWSSSDNTTAVLARIRSIGNSAVKEMIITQNGFRAQRGRKDLAPSAKILLCQGADSDPSFLQNPRVDLSDGCWLRGNAVSIPRRRFLRLAAGAAALPAVSRVARAQMTARFRDLGGIAMAGSPAEFRKLIGRRDREMGQGDPGNQHQAGVSRSSFPAP